MGGCTRYGVVWTRLVLVRVWGWVGRLVLFSYIRGESLDCGVEKDDHRVNILFSTLV